METKFAKEVRVAKLAQDKLKEYGLWRLGWRFKFSNGVKRLGHCDYIKQEIAFSGQYMKLKDDEILDVILHEIAHALDFVRYGNWGHGKSWKKICVEIGADPSRLAHDTSYVVPSKYTSYCEKCGKNTGQSHRRGKYTHRNCGGDIIFKVNKIAEHEKKG